MATSIILPYSGSTSYITLFWQHHLYYPIQFIFYIALYIKVKYYPYILYYHIPLTSVISPYSGNISYITLFWQHRFYYPILSTSFILPYFGNINYITLFWPYRLYNHILATSVILPYSGNIIFITLFWPLYLNYPFLVT